MEQGKFGEEAVVDVAHELDGRRTGIARYAAFEFRRAFDESFPLLELIFALDLWFYISLRKNCVVGV